MDQQWSATVKRWTASNLTKCPPLAIRALILLRLWRYINHVRYLLNSCPQPKSPLINRLINDHLSVNQTLPQLINISHRL